MRSAPLIGLTLVSAISLSACGGSGGGGGETSNTDNTAANTNNSSSNSNSSSTGSNDNSSSSSSSSSSGSSAVLAPDLPVRPATAASYSSLSIDRELDAPVETYYIRNDGGNFEQCTGLSNTPYPGNGSQQDCAFNHLYELLPPGADARMPGGSVVHIASGEYRMGYTKDIYDSGNCYKDWPYGCYMGKIPPGPSVNQPTRILGEGWDQECSNAPVLMGVNKNKRLLNLEESNNVDIRCLEVTDNMACVENHLHGYSARTAGQYGYDIYRDHAQVCRRDPNGSDTDPLGDWAVGGIYSQDSNNVILKDINIHGLSSYGIKAGRISNWLMEDVNIVGNGSVGFDGDISGDDHNSGDIVMRRVNISWNGCVEQLDGSIAGCWGQDAGGYGDGIGTGATDGHWIIEDSVVANNTSDGVDLLYVENGHVSIARTIASGNAGNQFKVAGESMLIENSIGISNCAHFKDQAYDAATNLCRAGGNTIGFSFFTDTSRAALINSYVTGNGDGLLGFSRRQGDDKFVATNSLTVVNNIFEGDEETLSGWGDVTFFLYTEEDPNKALAYHIYNNQIGGKVKYNATASSCLSSGVDNVCEDPSVDKGASELAPELTISNDNAGNTMGLAADHIIDQWVIPKYDFYGLERSNSGYSDIGPIEISREM